MVILELTGTSFRDKVRAEAAKAQIHSHEISTTT
jgi:hypothetical protein